MNAPHRLRPNLAQRLDTLPLSARAKAAAQSLSLTTVADFVLLPKEDFLHHPGIGQRTYAELEQVVAAYLGARLGDDAAHCEDERPLPPWLADERLCQQLADAGIRTVGDFLAWPKPERERVPAMRRGRYAKLRSRILEARRQPPAAAPLLPDALRQRNLRLCGLPEPLLHELLDLGCTTLGDALLLPGSAFEAAGVLGPQAAATIRDGLDRLLQPALCDAGHDAADQGLDWPVLRGRLLAALDDDGRHWLSWRLGLADGPCPPPRADEDASPAARDEAVRARLFERAPSLPYRLREEGMHELDAADGVVQPERLRRGTWLHAMAQGSGDPQLPLRVLAFCFPDLFVHHDGCVSQLPAACWQALRSRLQRLTLPSRLPLRMTELVSDLETLQSPLPRGVVLHLLGELGHLRLRVDPSHGEVVAPAQRGAARRLEQALLERGRPTRFADLLFDYRERFRSAQPQKLLAQLRKDPCFVQLAADVWSLRAWHADELLQLQPAAEQAIATICQEGGRHRIQDLCPGDERAVMLAVDILRRDPRVRYLGRGEACPAGLVRSRALEQLLSDFRRAMGEVPLGRFVANHPPQTRRLVERLLRWNRLFVFPAPDRIDVLTNYPFNAERLRRLNRLVGRFLDRHNGYADLTSVLAAVQETDLGGSWLQPILLGEVLRRHGPFEILPGGMIARRKLGLGGWLMRRARLALRDANVPISVEEILAERPELAEFAPCLRELLAEDPLVQSPDGSRFQIA